MRLFYIVFFLMACFLLTPTDSNSLSGSHISFSSTEMARGDIILLSIKAGMEEGPRVIWMEKEISLFFNRDRSLWQGFLAADLNSTLGKYKAIIQMPLSDFEKDYYIQVVDKDYGVRNLTLPKEKVELGKESLNRVEKESAEVNALWEADITLPKWSSAFIMPVDGDIVGPFGKRSVINNLERSPHTGVDLRAGTGDPVKSTNNGKAILVADHFFTGNSVFLDHGGGIISMYFHLDKILVKAGDTVEKGQVIGLAGSTGRATGPHLHWGVRINGSRVNPLTLVDISKGLEE
ncbi:MAG: M23 family metallopeptidase [Deltaproteobacteria bacterium]|nr:M23 family metallopeptidase [Deltaproteobacteria bacterium]